MGAAPWDGTALEAREAALLAALLAAEAALEAAEPAALVADARAPLAADEAEARAPEAAELALARAPEAAEAALPVREPKTVLKPVAVVMTEPAEFVMVARRGMVVTALAALPAALPIAPVTEAAAEAAGPVAVARAELKMGRAAATELAPPLEAH